MQIPALSSSVPNVLGSNARPGAEQQNAEQVQGQSKQSLQVTGRTSSTQSVSPSEESTESTAVKQNEAAASTKVVTNADEVLGTSIGNNVDVTV